MIVVRGTWWRGLSAVAVLATLGGAACEGRAAGEGPYAREVARAIPRIESATGLTFKRPPVVQTRTPQQVREYIDRKFGEELPALELAGMEQAYKLFGLLPDSTDLRAILLRVLGEQVVGYYDPATRVLYVVDDTSRGRAALLEVTIAHELVHALQDQYLPLDSLQHLRGSNDRTTAMQAMLEGQATYEQTAMMTGGAGMLWDRVREMIRENQAAMPQFSSAPSLVQESLLFPYLSGAEFTRRFKEARPGQVPYDPVPASTEQVLHIEKYLERDAPTRVTLPVRASELVYENDLGEFETRLFLYEHTRDLPRAARGAMGWDGDRYAVLRTAAGPALVWVSVWDTAVDAAEFRQELERVMAKRLGVEAGPAAGELRLAGKGRTVRVLSATVQGRPLVALVDAPMAAQPLGLDLQAVRLEP